MYIYCTVQYVFTRITGPKGTARAQRVHTRPAKDNACFLWIKSTRMYLQNGSATGTRIQYA